MSFALTLLLFHVRLLKLDFSGSPPTALLNPGARLSEATCSLVFILLLRRAAMPGVGVGSGTGAGYGYVAGRVGASFLGPASSSELSTRAT